MMFEPFDKQTNTPAPSTNMIPDVTHISQVRRGEIRELLPQL